MGVHYISLVASDPQTYYAVLRWVRGALQQGLTADDMFQQIGHAWGYTWATYVDNLIADAEAQLEREMQSDQQY